MEAVSHPPTPRTGATSSKTDAPAPSVIQPNPCDRIESKLQEMIYRIGLLEHAIPDIVRGEEHYVWTLRTPLFDLLECMTEIFGDVAKLRRGPTSSDDANRKRKGTSRIATVVADAQKRIRDEFYPLLGHLARVVADGGAVSFDDLVGLTACVGRLENDVLKAAEDAADLRSDAEVSQ